MKVFAFLAVLLTTGCALLSAPLEPMRMAGMSQTGGKAIGYQCSQADLAPPASSSTWVEETPGVHLLKAYNKTIAPNAIGPLVRGVVVNQTTGEIVAPISELDESAYHTPAELTEHCGGPHCPGFTFRYDPRSDMWVFDSRLSKSNPTRNQGKYVLPEYSLWSEVNWGLVERALDQNNYTPDGVVKFYSELDKTLEFFEDLPDFPAVPQKIPAPVGLSVADYGMGDGYTGRRGLKELNLRATYASSSVLIAESVDTVLLVHAWQGATKEWLSTVPATISTAVTHAAFSRADNRLYVRTGDNTLRRIAGCKVVPSELGSLATPSAVPTVSVTVTAG